jgi:autotransporter-associated beta strand protein
LTKLGAGTLTLTRANSYTGPTAVNAGTLAVSGSLAAASAVTVAAGATLNLTGAVGGNVTLNGTETGVGPIGGNLIINSTGTNNGTGSISGSLTNAGVLSPGASVTTATLTVLGNVTDLAGGATALVLNRGASPSNSVIFSGGTITYAGTLSVTNIGGTLQLGDSFKLFNGAYAGSFDSLALPPLGANLGWSNSLSVNGAISVVATVVPVPGINSFLQSGGNLVFSGTNGPASGAYYVLTSTNLSLPLSNWTVLSTNSFDASGNFSVTNPIVGGGPPGFFILQLAPQ